MPAPRAVQRRHGRAAWRVRRLLVLKQVWSFLPLSVANICFVLLIFFKSLILGHFCSVGIILLYHDATHICLLCPPTGDVLKGGPVSYPSPENQHQVVDKCLRERKAREKVNGTKTGRDGFHPRGLCSLIGEAGPRAAQHFACRVVINALRVTKARAGSQWVVERVLARATLRLEAGGAWRGRRKVKCFQHMRETFNVVVRPKEPRPKNRSFAFFFWSISNIALSRVSC